MTSKSFLRNLLRVTILCVIASFVIAPLLATALGGFKTNAEIRTSARLRTASRAASSRTAPQATKVR